MRELIIITILHHSDGKYRVYKDLGASPEVDDRLDIEFATPDEARAYAEALQKKHGGQGRATINDLTRRAQKEG
jgi:hypothetical protein